jgi:signal transduction histidine kinase
MLVVSVTDEGTCDFEDLEEMTRTFVKGKNSKGTGLGLAIVAKVMEQMGGKLTFDPDPTTFALWIREGGQA